jgi:ATPase subunit of ABC transporter with duplicated ATPase domains
MSRQLETTLTEAAARNLSAAGTPDWLADMEPEARRQRAIDRRFKCSRSQAQPSIDAFHFLHHKSRQQAKPRILRLLDLSFLDKGTHLVLIGNPGAGKTFLALANFQSLLSGDLHTAQPEAFLDCYHEHAVLRLGEHPLQYHHCDRYRRPLGGKLRDLPAGWRQLA